MNIKKIFSLVLIAIVAISGVGLYASQLQPTAAPSNMNIQIKMDDMNAGGNNYINLDSILSKYNFTNEYNQDVLNGIESKISEKDGIDKVEIKKDSKGVNYLVVNSNKPQHLNFTDQVAFIITDTVRINYILNFDCTFTPIETQINVNSSTPGEINQNTIIEGTAKAVNFYRGEDYFVSENYTGSMKANIDALDNPDQIHTKYSIDA